MAAHTEIQWTDSTFNPWVGCTKISPACDHCYAETWANRTGQKALWSGERRRTTDAYWRQPIKWNRDALAAGTRRKVFCASLADVFDNQVDPQWRRDLWLTISQTPYLDWLLLTKRPQNIKKMLPENWGYGWENVWLGTTVETMTEAKRRTPHLLSNAARVLFLSVEPMLEPIDLANFSRIDWVICGGESGHGARMMNPDWARKLRDQCQGCGVAFFMKQMTAKKPIPPDLLIRQFPVGDKL